MNNVDNFERLVGQIAGGDRSAFRRLYAYRALPVWREAIRTLAHPADARAVTRSTFVEVWHLAGLHVNRPRTDCRA